MPAAEPQKEKQPFPDQGDAEAIKVIGLRRVIAEKMQEAKKALSRIKILVDKLKDIVEKAAPAGNAGPPF